MLKDKDIRESLFEFLEEKYDKIRIIEEKSMGESRADVVAILTDKIVGIEIKSDADSYARLERQIKDYELYFDYNFIVVGSTHAKSVVEHVPKHWGIVSVEQFDNMLDFYIIREADINPNCKIEKKIRILWRPELAHILAIKEFPAYKAKSKEFVRDYLVEKVERQELDKLISDELFERDYNTIAEDIMNYRKNQNPQKRIRKKRYKKSV